MPVSIQFDSSFFSAQKINDKKLSQAIKDAIGPDFAHVTTTEIKRLGAIVADMRTSQKETCRKVKIENTPISFVFVRYKHDPADTIAQPVDEPEEEEEEEEVVVAPRAAPKEVAKKKPAASKSESSGDVHHELSEIRKQIEELKEMISDLHALVKSKK